MRSFFSWIWDEVPSFFSSSLSSYLVPFSLGVAGLSIIISTYLYVSLQTVQHEKAYAVAQVTLLEKTVKLLKLSKEAESTAAQYIIHKNDIWNDINIKTALRIAEIPRFTWEQRPKINQEQVYDNNRTYPEPKTQKDTSHITQNYPNHTTQERFYSNDQNHRGNNVQAYANNLFIEQESQHNETNTCSIDTVLPHVSAPLIMLYERVSRPHSATASSMAYGNTPLARTASQEHDSSPAGAVDKRTSHGFR